jgi:hypothetical protein
MRPNQIQGSFFGLVKNKTGLNYVLRFSSQSPEKLVAGVYYLKSTLKPYPSLYKKITCRQKDGNDKSG